MDWTKHGQSILRALPRWMKRPVISEEDLVKIIADYDGLIVRGADKGDRRHFGGSLTPEGGGRAGVGVDNIDLEAAKKHGVAVVNAPISTTIAVAELTMGLLLALAREFHAPTPP